MHRRRCFRQHNEEPCCPHYPGYPGLQSEQRVTPPLVNHVLVTSTMVLDVLDDVDVVLGSSKVDGSLALGVSVLKTRCVRQIQSLELLQVATVGCLRATIVADKRNGKSGSQADHKGFVHKASNWTQSCRHSSTSGRRGGCQICPRFASGTFPPSNEKRSWV